MTAGAARSCIDDKKGSKRLPGESPRGKHAPMHPTLLGLSHVRRAPKWSFNSPRAAQSAMSSDAPGPGTYGVQSADATSQFTRGPNFSFGTAGRDVMSRPKVPGPGAYTLVKEPGSSTHSWTMSPRRNDAHSAKTDMPGPGTHNVRSLIGSGPKFSTGMKLIDTSIKNGGPGPGDYNQVDNTNGSKPPAWVFSKADRPGFRSDSDDQVAKEPDFGTYNIASTVGQGPKITIKGRHPGPKVQASPGPGTHGGHYSSFG